MRSESPQSPASRWHASEVHSGWNSRSQTPSPTNSMLHPVAAHSVQSRAGLLGQNSRSEFTRVKVGE